MAKADRTMNVNETLTGTNVLTETFYGSPYGTPSSTVQTSSHLRRVRTPTGGKALPKVEKAFENGLLQVRFPSGTLNRADGVYGYISKGPHSGNYNMFSGNNLRFNMGYPMATSAKVPDAVGSYPPAVNVDLLSQVQVKCLNKLSDKSTADQLEFGLVWAERHETIKLFTDVSVGLLNIAKALKRGDFSSAMGTFFSDFKGIHPKHLKSITSRKRFDRQVRGGVLKSKNLLDRFSNFTLAYNLGITPLMKDLEAASQLLQTGLLTNDWDIKSVARYSRVVQDVEYDKWGTTRVEQTFNETHGYTSTLVARPIFSTRALLGRLGVTNLPYLAYNLTRVTFILDYIYAFGPWLKAMEVPMLFEFKDGSWTQKVDRIIILEIKQASAKMRKGEVLLTYTKRHTLGSWPIPLPPLSLRERELTDKQVLNTGLVAVQQLRGLLKSAKP